MTEIWEMLGHKQIFPTVTIEWLEPTVGLIRFLYSGPADYPYRGVVNVHIEGTEYEFKGMVFHASDDAPSLAEHRAVKGYLTSLGYRGISRRLKSGNVVMKMYGNSAKTETVEKLKMATHSFSVSWKMVNDETGKQEGSGFLESNGRTLTQVRHLQETLKNGYQSELEKIGDALAAAEDGASQAAA